jgi:hypothetical protein
VTLTCGAGGALGHSFAPPYTMPVPFSMYAFGTGAALVLSFVIVGLFATVPTYGGAPRDRLPVHAAAAPPAMPIWTVGKVLSIVLLMLCILTGFLGTQNLYANFNMTFFWIVFVLGVPYLTAVIGDFYAAVNPWKAIVEAVESLTGRAFVGVVGHPQRFGYYPALLLYMLFIWIELFARVTPRALSIALLIYTLINLAGAYLLGKSAWFRYGEFFGVCLRLIGKMSPWARPWDPQERAADPGGRRWRMPFVGLLEARAEHMSLVVFVLFMLSSTAFDGLHGTQAWVALFWKGLYPAIAPYFTTVAGQQYAFSTKLYYGWQWLSLAISPLAYLAVFGACVAAAKWAARSTLPVRELVLQLAFAMVPIAFVYHVTHYYTMLLAQGGQIVRLVSDPFGAGWNLRRQRDLAYAGRTDSAGPHRQRVPGSCGSASTVPDGAPCRPQSAADAGADGAVHGVRPVDSFPAALDRRLTCSRAESSSPGAPPSSPAGSPLSPSRVTRTKWTCTSA